MRQAQPFIQQCQISSRNKQRTSLTGTLTGLCSAPMACWTSWYMKAWNSPITSKLILKKDKRKTPDTLHLTKHNFDPSISSRSHFWTSNWRWPLYFPRPRIKTVQHCSAWWASVFRMLVSPSGPTLWASNTLTTCTWQRKTLKSASRLSRGHCRVPKHWQTTDLLALNCQEAHVHTKAQVYAASSAASAESSIERWSCPWCKRKWKKSF